MPAFTGTLRSNEIFSAIYNMIISQQVFADNIGKNQTLVDKARVDGGLYGDTKLFYSTDALKSAAWGNDSEATNLLALNRPAAPSCQAIVLDTFRQISLTVDNYLSKRAWADEGAFSSFNSVMMGWIGATKKIYDGTLYNAFIGTAISNVGKQSQNVVLGNTLTAEERAKYIGEAIANLLVEMGDYSRDFNDYGYLRSYAPEDIKVVWNSKYINEIRKIDIPAIFHKDGLIEKFDNDVLPARYFGHVASSADKGSGKIINASYEYDPSKGKLRFTKEVNATLGSEARHFFAGDEVPVKKLDGTTTLTVTIGATPSQNFNYADVYVEDDKVIAKVLVKYPPYMSAFEVGTSFFNAKSLTENHYLTWGHNTLEYLKNYPMITLNEVAS